ncbi:MAG: hypothetical protein L7W43_03200, partial [Rubripirellula sp.]|nr:hypothetical protein [Rubripirellula sp.]
AAWQDWFANPQRQTYRSVVPQYSYPRVVMWSFWVFFSSVDLETVLFTESSGLSLKQFVAT